MDEREVSFSTLKGLTLTNVEVDKTNAVIRLRTADRQFTMMHQQDCCESVWIESVVGNVDDLIGAPIIRAEESSNHEDREDSCESTTWTFYKLATTKGYVDIRWVGSSNGYYSERVDLMETIAATENYDDLVIPDADFYACDGGSNPLVHKHPADAIEDWADSRWDTAKTFEQNIDNLGTVTLTGFRKDTVDPAFVHKNAMYFSELLREEFVDQYGAEGGDDEDYDDAQEQAYLLIRTGVQIFVERAPVRSYSPVVGNIVVTSDRLKRLLKAESSS